MKKIILTITLLFICSFVKANDFKRQKIELDDAPISICDNLQGHKIKSVTKYVDQVGNQSYYVVTHKLGKKHFKSVYSAIGILEHENRQLLGLPYGVGLFLTGIIYLSFAL